MLATLLIYVALNFSTVWVPARGGTYVEGVAGAPRYLNPLLSNQYLVDGDLCALLFNGLTRLDERGEVVPDLALGWEVSDDGLTYTFELRQNARWHDGRPVTADDVLFTVRLLQDPDFPGSPDLSALWRSVKVEKEGLWTVRFTLQQPFAPFLDYTTIGLLPAHVLEGVTAAQLPDHPFNRQPVGTGPFRLVEIATEEGEPVYAILEANRQFYGPIPMLDRIQFKFYPSDQAVVRAYEAGEVAGIGHVPSSALAWARTNPSLNLFTLPLAGYTLVFLNLRNDAVPFLQTPEVRRALLYALDRQALIDEVLDGQGIVAHSPILPGTWAYNPNVRKYRLNRERTVALLKEEGWQPSTSPGSEWPTGWTKEGQPLAFSLLTADDPQQVALAEAMAEQWATVGIQVLVEAVSPTELQDRLTARQFQALLVELILPGDPDPYPFWHQTQIEEGQNYAGYDSRDASEWLEEARQTTDRRRRRELYWRFQELFAEDVPSLLLYHPVYNYAVDKSVRGVEVGPLNRPGDRFRSVASWYIQLRRVIQSEASAR
ncbi:MAG: peptide ABC transporter substrate-binding protein [Chloroflexi bacterium]|nr:MAG: peptide ABC transporter substrate-binding protein [Chloroflexota bacterium]